jgi:hypothetical protein
MGFPLVGRTPRTLRTASRSLRSLNREPWFETARIVESILLAVNPIRPFAKSLWGLLLSHSALSL